jgi:KDO2-lipid IV(A) lauroyltransferase
MKYFHSIMVTAVHTFFIFLGLIPRSVSRCCGNFIGKLWYLADRRRRNITLDNLRRAFADEKSEKEINILAKKVFCNIGQIPFEIGWSLRLRRDDFDRYFHIEGLTNYLNALEKGRGVLVLTAHMGNWELLPVVSAMTGKTVSVVYRPLDFSPLDEFFIYCRSRFGDRVLARSGAMKKIVWHIKRGEAVAMLMDQNVGWRKGVFVDFFGCRACTSKFMALLAIKTGAVVVPLFVARENDGFRAEFGAEAPLIVTGDNTKDIEENTQQYNHIIEAFVRRYPDQWFWVHQRWKTRPYRPWPRV